MSLPNLKDWKEASDILHQVVSLFGPIHKALQPHRDNYLHLPMEVRPKGLESQTLPGGGKIHLNLEAGSLTLVKGGGSSESFDFKNHTQRSLFEGLLEALRDEGFGEELGVGKGDSLATGNGDSLAAALVGKLVSEEKAGRFLTLAGVTRDEPLQVDLETASAYADVQYSVFTALARFRARVGGAMTPIIVWPEHFDLSTLWFPPTNPGMDDHGPHISIGFAPFTPGQYEDPYLYAYAYPYPDSFDPPALPSSAIWHNEGWQGAVVGYHEIARQKDHELFVEDVTLEVFRRLSAVLER